MVRGTDYEGTPPPPAAPASLQGERRVALVIGNGAYTLAVGPLTNPLNDARAFAEKLGQPEFGFSVSLHLDLKRSDMLQAFNKFYEQAAGATDAVVYYAGHGVQVGGTNVLLPVDFAHDPTLVQELLRLEIPALGVGLDRALASTAKAARTVIILDACRNDLMRDAGFQSESPLRSLMDLGFGKVGLQAAHRNNTLVAFSADAGQKAFDGLGKHSPYTQALLDHLDDDHSITDLLTKVRARVLTETGDRQRPREDSTLASLFKFSLKVAPPPSVAAVQNVDDRTIAYTRWTFLQQYGTILDLASFIASGTAGQFSGDAQRLLDVRISENADVSRLQRLMDEYPNAVFAYAVRARLDALKPLVVETLPALEVVEAPQSPRPPKVLPAKKSGRFNHTFAALIIGSAAAGWYLDYRLRGDPEVALREAAAVALRSARALEAEQKLAALEKEKARAAEAAAQRDPVASLEPGSGKQNWARDRLKDGSVCGSCPEMVVVPAGQFTMGSPADEPERADDEQQVPITIARPFAVGRFEVTWTQWEACVAETDKSLACDNGPVLKAGGDQGRAEVTGQ